MCTIFLAVHPVVVVIFESGRSDRQMGTVLPRATLFNSFAVISFPMFPTLFLHMAVFSLKSIFKIPVLRHFLRFCFRAASARRFDSFARTILPFPFPTHT